MVINGSGLPEPPQHQRLQRLLHRQDVAVDDGLRLGQGQRRHHQADRLRRELGIETVMLTGDNTRTAAAIAQHHGDAVPVYIYEGAGHGFNNESPERHSAEAADLARHRTLELFDKA